MDRPFRVRPSFIREDCLLPPSQEYKIFYSAFLSLYGDFLSDVSFFIYPYFLSDIQASLWREKLTIYGGPYELEMN